MQNTKFKIRKLKTTSKPRPIKESQSATEAASSPAFVNRTELDFEADGTTRKETVDENGNIVGSYSYKDPNGKGSLNKTVSAQLPKQRKVSVSIYKDKDH